MEGGAPDLLRALLALLAVLIVLALLLASRWLPEQRERSMLRDELRAEIDYNLSLLMEYWRRQRPRESSEDEVHSMQKRRYALDFARTPLPPFARAAYAARLPLLRAYRSKEFLAVTNFYADLARLQELQRELQAALPGDLADRPAAAGSEPEVFEAFSQLAGRSWDDAWHRIERLLAQGNPLK